MPTLTIAPEWPQSLSVRVTQIDRCWVDTSESDGAIGVMVKNVNGLTGHAHRATSCISLLFAICTSHVRYSPHQRSSHIAPQSTEAAGANANMKTSANPNAGKRQETAASPSTHNPVQRYATNISFSHTNDQFTLYTDAASMCVRPHQDQDQDQDQPAETLSAPTTPFKAPGKKISSEMAAIASCSQSCLFSNGKPSVPLASVSAALSATASRLF